MAAVPSDFFPDVFFAVCRDVCGVKGRLQGRLHTSQLQHTTPHNEKSAQKRVCGSRVVTHEERFHIYLAVIQWYSWTKINTDSGVRKKYGGSSANTCIIPQVLLIINILFLYNN